MSRLKIACRAATIACAVLITTMYLSSLAYTGSFDASEEFWLVVFATVPAGTGWIAAYVGERILQEVRAARAGIEDLPLHISDYGDRREVRGHKLALGVIATQNSGRRLNTVD